MADWPIVELEDADVAVWTRSATARSGAVVTPAEVETVWTNRGRTAAGVYVFWKSVGAIDLAGLFYPYSSPPWGDIVSVVGVAREQR